MTASIHLATNTLDISGHDQNASPRDADAQRGYECPITAMSYPKANQEEGSWTLFVWGKHRLSKLAQENFRRITEIVRPPTGDVQIVDISNNPQLAEDERIFAFPTLVLKRGQGRTLFLLGDLSNLSKVEDYLQYRGPSN